MPSSTTVGSVGIRVLPETRNFVPSLEKYLNRVERQIEFQVRLGVDASRVDDQVRVVQQRVGRYGLNLNADVDTAAAAAQMERFIQRMSGREIDVRVNTNRALAAVSQLGGSLASFATSGLKIGSIVTGIGGLTSAALAAGGAVANLSGALGVLPALGAAGAVAIGTLVVGMRGFGEALKNMSDPAKFQEALANLAPSARAAAVAVKSLSGPFGQLRLDVQQKLFAGLGDTIRNVGQSYLPVLREGMTGVASATNGVVKQFASFLTTQRSLDDTALIFANVRASASDFGGALVNIAAMFRDVAAVGAPFLQKLAFGFKNGTASAREFIANARQTGQLREWIQTGLDAFGQLWQVVKNVGAILKNLFSAANVSGGGFLGTLVEITGAIRGFLESARGMRAMEQIFAGIQAPLRAIGSVAGQLTSTLGNVLVSLAPVVERIGVAVGQVLANGLRAILPVVPVIANAMLGLLNALMPIIPLVGQLVSTFLPPLARLFAQILTAVQPIASVLINVASTALPPLMAAVLQVIQALTPLVPLLGNIVRTLLPPLAQLFVAVVQAVAPLIPPIVSLIGAALRPLAQVLAIVIRALRPLLPPIQQLIAALLPPLQALFTALTPVIMPLVRAVISLVNALIPILSPITQLISALLPPLIRVLSAAVTPVVKLASALVSKAAPAVRAVIGVIGDFIGWIGRMVGGVANGVAKVIQFFGDLGGKVLGALANVGSWLVDTGKQLIQGLINGIGSAIGGVVDTVVGGVKNAVSAVGDFLGIGSPSRLMMQIGRWTAEGMAIGIDDGAPLAAKSAQQLANGVAVSPSIDATVRAANGGSSVAEQVRSALAGMGIEVNAGQVTRWVDRQTLVNSGR